MDGLMFIVISITFLMTVTSITIFTFNYAEQRKHKRYSAILDTRINRSDELHIAFKKKPHINTFLASEKKAALIARSIELVATLPALPFERANVIKRVSTWAARYAPAEIQAQAPHIFSWKLVLVAVVCVLTFLMGCGEIGFAVCCASVFLPSMWFSHVRKKELLLIREQMIEFLDSLSDSLKANKSLGQAFQSFKLVCKKPLKPVIEQTVALMACGLFPDQAFCEATKSIEIQEIQALGTALQIQYKTGGNLNNLLAEFSNHFREAILFEQNLKAQTAQGRLSVKVVGIVPPLLIVVMNLIVPGYFSSFLSTSLGRLLFGFALIWDLIGLLLVRQIMSLSVEL